MMDCHIFRISKKIKYRSNVAASNCFILETVSQQKKIKNVRFLFAPFKFCFQYEKTLNKQYNTNSADVGYCFNVTCHLQGNLITVGINSSFIILKLPSFFLLFLEKYNNCNQAIQFS